MTKQSKAKVTKAQMVLAIVSRTPECVLQDVCDALDLQASTAGNLLRQLHPITATSMSIEWLQALRFPMLPCRRLQHNYLKRM
ncbi:TPA: hypothetical protein L7V20_004575 [Klebsiella pneumoniae]|nr:hypothetical protein [Klebsiella pneumoniae]